MHQTTCSFVFHQIIHARTGFGEEHNIEKSLHFYVDGISAVPKAMGLESIPHKAIVAADGTVLFNFDFLGTTLENEVAKL